MTKFYRNVMFPTLESRGIKRVIHAGDFVDRRKYVNGATARFIFDEYTLPMRRLGVTQDILVGNHDSYYRHTTDVSIVEELFRNDANVRVHSNPTEIDVDGTGILLLPWIMDNNREASMKLIDTSKCAISIGHLELSGFQMYRGMMAPEGMDPAPFNRFELVMSGHYHHKSQQGPVTYLGSMFQMIWSDYDDPRGFHVFDTDTHELEFIENPYTLFAKIHYHDDGQPHDYIKALVQSILEPNSHYHDAYVKVIVRSKTQAYWFDLMMDALYKVNAQDVVVVDDIVVQDENTTEGPVADIDTLTLMKDYVDTLSISCDKDELFAYLQEKYKEAMATTESARLS